ncbi:MAG: M67 family metallopeptidase [Pseudomonadota bacterium]
MSVPAAVVLRPAHRRAIADASLAALPGEACGLLLGHLDGERRVITQVRVTRNALAASRHDRFEIEPAQLLRIHRQARAEGLHVLGHFHSHPNGHGEPSTTDAAHVYDLGQLWLIQPIIDDAAGPLTAWLVVRARQVGWPFVGLAIYEEGA